MRIQLGKPAFNGDLTEEEATHSERLEQFCLRDLRYPENRFAGRGIVIAAGGERYFTCAWVCIHMLRRLGCELPIEVWHLGSDEMDDEMRNLLSSIGVCVVDGREMLQTHPVRILNGWELKAYSLLHSRFSEVLFIDADNVPVVDPGFLFDTQEYQACGAIFWPDYGRLERHRKIWRITGVEYQDEPEFETGQIVVDKRRCWRALNITMHLNEYSDFYYRYIHGDKETFHIAWRKLRQPYAMPNHFIHALRGTMCQHDFEGRRIFQHRNMEKWSFEKPNARVHGFLFEKECLSFIKELRDVHQWLPARQVRWNPEERQPAEQQAAIELTSCPYAYHRVGHDQRRMTLVSTGRVQRGAEERETYWNLRICEGHIFLDIFSSRKEKTATLRRHDDGVWRGQWLVCEKMPIELAPQPMLAYRAT